MNVGISSACLYPEVTEKAVKYLCENGAREIEIFFNSACELKGKILSEISHITKLNGTEVVSVHPFTSGFEPFMLFSDYQRRFEDGLEFCKAYFDAMNTLGAEIFVLHGDRFESRHSDERYFERYLRLFREAKKEGICVAQENVCRCRSRDVDFIKNMKSSLKDEVAFVLDLKQATRSELGYKEVLSAMGDRLVHLHLNDCDEHHDCLLPGKGTRDFKELFKTMQSIGYKGSAVIEVYRQNFGEYGELMESLDFLNNVLK